MGTTLMSRPDREAHDPDMTTTKALLATVTLLAVVLLATFGPAPDHRDATPGPASSGEVLAQMHTEADQPAP